MHFGIFRHIYFWIFSHQVARLIPDAAGLCRILRTPCWGALDAEVWDPAFNHFQWCMVVFLKKCKLECLR